MMHKRFLNMTTKMLQRNYCAAFHKTVSLRNVHLSYNVSFEHQFPTFVNHI